MSKGRLLAVTLERFKGFKDATTLQLKPLTVILGRNNCGKSSLIQTLLLLKQTLNNPRPDVSIDLEGMVDAFNLRELTHGWPDEARTVTGPCFTLEWESVVHKSEVVDQVRGDFDVIASNSGVSWLREFNATETLKTQIKLHLIEVEGVSKISRIELWSLRATQPEANGLPSLLDQPLVTFDDTGGTWKCRWQGTLATKLVVEVQHFIPFVQIDRRNIGPRSRERAWHNAFLLLFDQPLADLSKILSELHFLGSSRLPPTPLQKFATTAPNEIGVSGELAGQLLQKRQREFVHFLPPLQVADTQIAISDAVVSRPMGIAVNEVMQALGVDTRLRIEEIKDVGFRLMFGKASLVHVGRGLNSLLPLIELGLFADPIRFSGDATDTPLQDYREKCESFSHIALEEPEAHLHPKVASRLAHWLVSLSMTNRCVLVETHSDHLVRRLRGLAARADAGSDLESWLLNNVAIVMVEQSDGCSHIQTSHLTKDGGVENRWPADFMDEATDEESAIYYAKLDKESSGASTQVEFTEGDEPELETEP